NVAHKISGQRNEKGWLAPTERGLGGSYTGGVKAVLHRKLTMALRVVASIRTKAHALHPAAEGLGAFRRKGAGINPHPGNFRGKAAIFDLRAAVHDDFHACVLGAPRGLIVAHRELHPDHLWLWIKRYCFLDDRWHGGGTAKNIDHVDRLGNVGELCI